MNELSAGDVLEITGMTPKRLQVWCEKGLVKPAGGQGRGDHRRFTLMQVVGIGVAVHQRNSERSCALSYVGLVVECFDNISEKDLLKKFEREEDLFVRPHFGKPLLEGGSLLGDYGWPNVKKIYKQVKKVVNGK